MRTYSNPKSYETEVDLTKNERQIILRADYLLASMRRLIGEQKTKEIILKLKMDAGLVPQEETEKAPY